jgi:hypothetical protein
MEDLSDSQGGNRLWALWKRGLGVSRFGLQNLEILLFGDTCEFWLFVVIGIWRIRSGLCIHLLGS